MIAVWAALLVGCAAPDKTVGPVGGVAFSAAATERRVYLVELTAGIPEQAAASVRAQAVALGGTVRQIYRHAITGFSVELPIEAADGLERNPNVELIEPDGIATVTETQSPAVWGLDRIDQRALPLDQSYTYPNAGAGVTAYIIDTGIRTTHNDFGGRAVWGPDFTGETPFDCHGHGTHVAGTVGGTTYGVAKAVALVSVRVFGCGGSASFETIIAAVDWVTANAVKPAVANMSLGGGFHQITNDAVTGSIASGVSYAIAAGNNAADACNTTPASTPNAVTLGASDIADFRAFFSNYGPCLDLFAPGVSVISSYNCSDTCTASFSGTSMAAPHAAGVLALHLSSNPAATPQEARDAVVNAATTNVILGPGTGSPNLLLFVVGGSSEPPPPPPPPPPSADFSTSCAGRTCTFSAVNAGSWDFGDNTPPPPDGLTASHTFAKGRFVVRHTVAGNPVPGVKQLNCNPKNRCQ